MTDPSRQRRIITFCVGAAVILFIGWFLFARNTVKQATDSFGGGMNFERTAALAIGSSTASSTLTASLGGGSASSSPILTKGFPNMVIAGSYLPQSYGSKMFIYILRSLDNGTTYKPYDVIESSADDVLVHVSSTAGSVTGYGTPFSIPGVGASASGTSISFSYDLTLAADYVRILVSEVTTSTAGQAHVQLLLNTN